MKKYRSKIGFGIVLFIAILIGGTSAIMINNQVWLTYYEPPEWINPNL